MNSISIIEDDHLFFLYESIIRKVVYDCRSEYSSVYMFKDGKTYMKAHIDCTVDSIEIYREDSREAVLDIDFASLRLNGYSIISGKGASIAGQKASFAVIIPLINQLIEDQDVFEGLFVLGFINSINIDFPFLSKLFSLAKNIIDTIYIGRTLNKLGDIKSIFDSVFSSNTISNLKTDSSGTIISSGGNLLNSLGYSDAFLKGKNISILFKNTIATSFIHSSKVIETTLMHKDVNVPFWVRLSSFVSDNETIILFQDINVYKSYLNSLLQRTTRYQKLFDHSSDGLIVCDTDYKIKFFSKSVIRVTGFFGNYEDPKHISDLIGPEAFSRVSTIMESMPRNIAYIPDPVVFTLEARSGQNIRLEMSCAWTYDEKNSPLSSIFVLRDITKRTVPASNAGLCLKALSESGAALILTDSDLNISAASGATLSLFGVEAEYLSSAQLTDLISRLNHDILRMCIYNGGGIVFIDINRKDGGLLNVRCSVSLLRDSSINFLIEPARDYYDKSTNSDNVTKYSTSLVNSLSMARPDLLVWALNLKLEMVYISPSVYNLLGYTQEESLKMDFSETYPKESLAIIYNAFNDCFSSIDEGIFAWNKTLHIHHRKNSSKKLTSSLSLSMLRDKNNQIIGIMGIEKIKTRRKRAA